MIIEVHAPGLVDDHWVQQEVGNAIEEEFGKRLTLWSVDEDEAFEYWDVDPGATTGALDLSNNVSVIWHLARIA
jgi:hypothetical protein